MAKKAKPSAAPKPLPTINPLLHATNNRDPSRRAVAWEARLPADTSELLERTANQREFVDQLRGGAAREALTRLPGPGRSLHGVMRGNYDGFDLIEAAIAAGGPLEWLGVATLGFNARNGRSLLRTLDAHRCPCLLVVSCYHAAHYPAACEQLAGQLRARGGAMHAVRSHAKLALFAFRDGARYSLETSGNLRSCRMVEQWALHEGADLLAFHRGWLEALCAEAGP